MEAKKISMHYLDDVKCKQFVVCWFNDVSHIDSRKYSLPYESEYVIDSIQLKNDIYFTGGGVPQTENSKETFFQIVMRVTINASHERKIEKRASMNVPRANHSMAEIGEELIFVVGGSNVTGSLSSCEQYSIAKNVWTPIASLNTPKKWIGLTSFANKYLFSFGGFNSSFKKGMDEIERIEVLKSGALWEKITLKEGVLPPNYFLGVSEVSPKSILVFGGLQDQQERDQCWQFDPSSDSVTEHSPLKQRDTFYRSKSVKAHSKLILVGNHNADLHIYDSTTSSWTIQLKSIWNPNFVYTIKAETF